MKLFEQLKKEMAISHAGTYAPYYFRYLGIQNHLNDPIALLRAHGIHSLFSKTCAHIFPSDLIVGSTYGANIEESEYVLAHAKQVTDSIGERSFITNKDHYAPNYEKTLRVGVPGLIAEIDDSLAHHAGDEARCITLRSMKIALEGFLEQIRHYAEAAEQCKSNPLYNAERLDFIAKNCYALTEGAPKTFAQALQLIWFCHNAFLLEGRYAMAIGRLDQYLYPFYKRDIENDTLTQEAAIELLECTFIKIKNDVVNICIGGTDMEGKCQINEVSYCILWAVKHCNIPGPNLSARITPDTPDEFLDEALQSIGTGLGYPALMNDTVNMAALRRYGYSEEDVRNYSMVGCIENLITGKQPAWSDGRFDTPRYLDYVIFNGISAFNRSAGIQTGDVSELSTMEEFVRRFERQLARGVEEYCLSFRTKNGGINQAYYAEPFLSCFCDDCIGRGLDMNNSGSIYPSVHGVGIMGIATMCDSLAAIEKVIFEDRAATLEELRDALKANFEGYEALRAKLIAAPKYGNNDPFVDKYAVWFVDYMASLFEHQKTRDGGGIYLAMAANVQNVSAGLGTGATPDGRRQGDPLSDAASPTYGCDKRGVTCTFASLSKPDYSQVACGSVVNQKFPPSMFEPEKRKKLAALIRAYFLQGGQELQMNATSREVLIDAMEHPENYRSLVVRVSGFSDYYTKLDKGVQLDILNRTQQTL